MTYVTLSTEVDVYLDEFNDDDLISEMEARGLACIAHKDIITDIFHKRRMGQDYQRELDELIYETIGRIC